MTKKEWIKKFEAICTEKNIDKSQKLWRIADLETVAKEMECPMHLIMQYLRYGRI